MSSTCFKRNSPNRSISGSRCHCSASIQPLRNSNAGARLVRPEAIELLPEHIRFEQPPIHREECPQRGAF